MSNEDFVSRQWLIDEYHRRHQGPPGGALKMIEEAPAADVEPKQRWIPVTEGLPEERISPMTMDYTEYPCVFDGRAGQREVRYYKFGKGHFWHGSGCIDEYVTHWAEPMPLPEPPKGEDDAEVY